MSDFNKKLLEEHKQMIIDAIKDEVVTDSNIDDLHYLVFNQTPLFIYTSDCIEWIDENFDNAFNAIEIVIRYEKDNFCEITTKTDPYHICNMLSYICGEEVLSELEYTDLESLKEALEMED